MDKYELDDLADQAERARRLEVILQKAVLWVEQNLPAKEPFWYPEAKAELD